jgi:hypothetical protein
VKDFKSGADFNDNKFTASRPGVVNVSAEQSIRGRVEHNPKRNNKNNNKNK